MAIDPKWLRSVRQKNRAEYGMAGMEGLGASSATQISDTLASARAARVATQATQANAAADLAAKRQLASDPRTAALLALPRIEIPQASPIPREWLIGGAIAAAALIGLIIWRSR